MCNVCYLCVFVILVCVWYLCVITVYVISLYAHMCTSVCVHMCTHTRTWHIHANTREQLSGIGFFSHSVVNSNWTGIIRSVQPPLHSVNHLAKTFFLKIFYSQGCAILELSMYPNPCPDCASVSPLNNKDRKRAGAVSHQCLWSWLTVQCQAQSSKTWTQRMGVPALGFGSFL